MTVVMTKQIVSYIPPTLICSVSIIVLATILGQFHKARQVVVILFIPAWHLMDNSFLHSLQPGATRTSVIVLIMTAYIWASVALLFKTYTLVRTRLENKRSS